MCVYVCLCVHECHYNYIFSSVACVAGMDDDYGKNDDQQGDSGGPSDKDGGPELTPLDQLFQHAVSPKPADR